MICNGINETEADMQAGSVIGGCDETANEYHGLIERSEVDCPELHGHVITMDGTIVVPVLRPAGLAC